MTYDERTVLTIQENIRKLEEKETFTYSGILEADTWRCKKKFKGKLQKNNKHGDVRKNSKENFRKTIKLIETKLHWRNLITGIKI